MFALLASLALVFLASSLSLVSAIPMPMTGNPHSPPPCHDSFCLDDLTTCKFTIHFPHSNNTNFTSELIHGSFTYNPRQPLPSPYAGYPHAFVLHSLEGERVLYRGAEASEFRIVSLIPDMGKPPMLTNYSSSSGQDFYFFDSQHSTAQHSQHTTRDSYHRDCGACALWRTSLRFVRLAH